jgi:hypothetical protein
LNVRPSSTLWREEVRTVEAEVLLLEEDSVWVVAELPLLLVALSVPLSVALIPLILARLRGEKPRFTTTS